MFNVDAGELVDELTATIGALQKENIILRHQLKDAEKQIKALKAPEKVSKAAEPVAG